jgi:ankyrin repeat protein
LIDAGANVDAVNDLEFAPLHWAAGNGHTGVVALLMDFGATATLKGHNGATPRDMAMAKGHTDIARMLEARGADSS